MNDTDYLAQIAIESVIKNSLSYCKFLSANDTGDTGAHQSGIYVAKSASEILFDSKGIRGSNKDKAVEIKWQGDFITQSRFIYYGKGTRNEYRITRFGRGFPLLRSENTGDLFVLTKITEDYYEAFVLSTEDEINTFLDSFGMSPTDTNGIIQQETVDQSTKTELLISQFIRSLEVEFPASIIMSQEARDIVGRMIDSENQIRVKPDQIIVTWIEMEYRLFRSLELSRYGDTIRTGFKSVEEFIEIANMVLNRRKSRAGKSLENHLAAIFTGNNISFEEQCVTEGNKRPDFIFPDCKSYHDLSFSKEKLTFLGAKTTCKDRWRQIINEANRIEHKHLFTLQQGISSKQIDEMQSERITLVVPAVYHSSYPQEKRDQLWTLEKFIRYLKLK